jgi:1-acyl-sn-glycerol-3-phosphate acyltransferase
MLRWLRLGLAFGRIGLHLASGVMKVGLFFRYWGDARRHTAIRAWSCGALDIFGMSVTARGNPECRATHGRLIAANHTSWIDIIALFVVADVVFVAKADVEKWPVIGWLATRLGTIFLERRTTRDLARGVSAITDRLQRGETVVVFPEGTTTDGTHLLPFRAALFEAAANSGCVVQPVAICYRRSDGEMAQEATFTGEMSLLGSFAALADTRGTSVSVAFLTEFQSAGLSRQALAGKAEFQVRTHLALLPVSVASPPEISLTEREAA